MSIDFNATGYLSASDISDYYLGTNSFTFAMWMRVDSLLTAKTLITQSVGGAASDSAFYIGVGYNGSSSISLFPAQSDGTGYDTALHTANGIFTTNTDYLVCISRAVGGTDEYRISLDGVSKATSSRANKTYYDATRVMEIGAQNGGAIFHGEIWDTRLYNGKALTLDEEKILYNSKGNDNIADSLVLKVPSIGLTGVTPTSVIDISRNTNNYTMNGAGLYVARPIKTIKRRR